MESVSQQDRAVLRALAARQAEYAQSEENKSLVADWYAHNACHAVRPMVHLETWTFRQELVPQRLACEGGPARRAEEAIYDMILNRELFADDRPVPDYFPVALKGGMKPFGLQVNRDYAADSAGTRLGHRFTHHIQDLEEDFGKLGQSEIALDVEGTKAEIAWLNDIFGDILPARFATNCLYSVPTQDIVHIMGMETMLFSMCDYPDLFHQMMRRYTDDTLRYYNLLEEKGLLNPTAAFESLGQGSWCFTRELPQQKSEEGLKTANLWGFMDSQETVGVSPEMYGEFIFPYYKEISARYGLLSYGCCEPVDPIWDSYLSTLPNLRKVSISPWCNEEAMAERLAGRPVIYHRKPSPNFLGVGTALDEQAFRAHIAKSIRLRRGKPLEITQRDVYTINHDIPKARRYVQIIREEIEKNW